MQQPASGLRSSAATCSSLPQVSGAVLPCSPANTASCGSAGAYGPQPTRFGSLLAGRDDAEGGGNHVQKPEDLDQEVAACTHVGWTATVDKRTKLKQRPAGASTRLAIRAGSTSMRMPHQTRWCRLAQARWRWGQQQQQGCPLSIAACVLTEGLPSNSTSLQQRTHDSVGPGKQEHECEVRGEDEVAAALGRLARHIDNDHLPPLQR